MVSNATGTAFDFCAGHLAADFANTVTDRVNEKGPIERIPTYAELVRFAEQAKLVSSRERARLLAWAEAHPGEAQAVRAAAVELREALYAIFAAVANGEPPGRRDLDVLNDWRTRLVLNERLEWTWASGPDAPDAFLAPVVQQAFEILTGDLRGRVRMCARGTCGWVFVDVSKNRSRRWCDMKQCGNREKARRYYERHT